MSLWLGVGGAALIFWWLTPLCLIQSLDPENPLESDSLCLLRSAD